VCIQGISDKEWRFEGAVRDKKECGSDRTKTSDRPLTRGNDSRSRQHLNKSDRASEKDSGKTWDSPAHGLKRRCVGTSTDWEEKTLKTSHVLSSATRSQLPFVVVETRKSGESMSEHDCDMTAER